MKGKGQKGGAYPNTWARGRQMWEDTAGNVDRGYGRSIHRDNPEDEAAYRQMRRQRQDQGDDVRISRSSAARNTRRPTKEQRAKAKAKAAAACQPNVSEGEECSSTESFTSAPGVGSTPAQGSSAPQGSTAGRADIFRLDITLAEDTARTFRIPLDASCSFGMLAALVAHRSGTPVNRIAARAGGVPFAPSELLREQLPGDSTLFALQHPQETKAQEAKAEVKEETQDVVSTPAAAPDHPRPEASDGPGLPSSPAPHLQDVVTTPAPPTASSSVVEVIATEESGVQRTADY